MKISCFAATMVVVAMAVTAASAQEILIRRAKVYTVSNGIMEKTDVLIRDGKIAAIGQKLRASSDVTLIEANGRPLTPGIFAGLSQIGVDEISGEASTVDDSLKFKAPDHEQQWRPEFDITLAYDPQSTLVPIARIEGLTWTVLAPVPGDTIIAGQGAAVTLDGREDAMLPDSWPASPLLRCDARGSSPVNLPTTAFGYLDLAQ